MCSTSSALEMSPPHCRAELPRRYAAPDVDQRRMTQALSIAFRLATLAEENASAQHRTRLEDEAGMDSVSGYWGRILADLQAAGHEGPAIAKALAGIEVEPVLTAHPTEAKRATVLEQHRSIYLGLVRVRLPASV